MSGPRFDDRTPIDPELRELLREIVDYDVRAAGARPIRIGWSAPLLLSHEVGVGSDLPQTVIDRTYKVLADTRIDVWMEIEVRGRGELTLEVNGRVQNEARWCEEVAGKICLQSEGAWIEFRNIVLRPILD